MNHDSIILFEIFSFYEIETLNQLKIKVMQKNWVQNLRNDKMNHYNHDNMRSKPVNQRELLDGTVV
jgi:hypothetical protein